MRVAVTKCDNDGSGPKLGTTGGLDVRFSSAAASVLLVLIGEAMLGATRRKEMRSESMARKVFMLNMRWLQMIRWVWILVR